MRKIYSIILINFLAANLLYLIFSMLSAEISIPKDSLTSQQSSSDEVTHILNLPISGFCSTGFEDFDKALIKFLISRGFSGATLAIIKDGEFLVKRGYGWSDKNRTQITNPDDFFRIASLTKILTAIAIKNLIQTNKISYETKAIDFLGNFKNILDPNIKKITVFHLLFHQGGWNTDQSLDPLMSLKVVANKLNKKTSELTPFDILKYTIQNLKLDFMPGTDTKYNNLSFSVLGRIIEKASQKTYLNFINNIIFKPENARAEIGPVKLSDKSPSEIEFYKSNDIFLNDDSISLKAADSSFGLITSAPNLAKILDKYCIDGDRKVSGEQRQLLKTGTLPGSMALARQRYSGASIVVLINSRDNNNPEMDNSSLQQLIDNVANKCGI